MSHPLCLVTIPFSHYCEKARWALERAGLEFDERALLPVLHMTGTLPLGGRSVPILGTGGRNITDSTDIALYVDSLADESVRLYPAEAGPRQEAIELEELFDRRLGPHSRRWLYFHLLAERPRVIRFMRPYYDEGQIKLFDFAFPVFARMMKRVMRITPESSRRSLDYLRGVFDMVSERLADGRRFLLGDRFSIADVTFAALGAPAVFPENYGGPKLPRFTEVPPSLASEVESFRKSRAGEFALRVYGEQRFASAPAR